MLFGGLQSLEVSNYLVNLGRIDGSKLMMIIVIRLLSARGFPAGSEDKASACNAGHLGSIPGQETRCHMLRQRPKSLHAALRPAKPNK